MPKSDDWTIDGEDFDRLLTFLDPDNRDGAAERYVTLRRALVKMFASRRCPVAEELADETMFRVARKTRTLKKFEGDFALYIYRVARFVYREWLRRWLRENRLLQSPPPPPPGHDEVALSCQDECLASWPAPDRGLMLEYYLYEGRARIENRMELARKYGLSQNALRIKACKLRARLLECVKECVGRSEAG